MYCKSCRGSQGVRPAEMTSAAALTTVTARGAGWSLSLHFPKSLEVQKELRLGVSPCKVKHLPGNCPWPKHGFSQRGPRFSSHVAQSLSVVDTSCLILLRGVSRLQESFEATPCDSRTSMRCLVWSCWARLDHEADSSKPHAIAPYNSNSDGVVDDFSEERYASPPPRGITKTIFQNMMPLLTSQLPGLCSSTTLRQLSWSRPKETSIFAAWLWPWLSLQGLCSTTISFLHISLLVQ